jgi:hypothetical protein
VGKVRCGSNWIPAFAGMVGTGFTKGGDGEVRFQMDREMKHHPALRFFATLQNDMREKRHVGKRGGFQPALE